MSEIDLGCINVLGDYFYPDGYWGGYFKFFVPPLRSRAGEQFVSDVYNALANDDWQNVLHVLSKGCAASKPTSEANKAIDLILNQTYGVTE